MKNNFYFVQDFYNKQKIFNDQKKSFEKLKKSFEKEMEAIFGLNNQSDSVSFFNANSDFNETYIVKKRVRTYIKWNFEKLIKNLGKKVSSQVISKKYFVNDMYGLIKYLKECNVDPKIFKSYISIEYSLDEKELDNLELLGKVSKDQIKDCFEISFSKPWYTIEKS